MFPAPFSAHGGGIATPRQDGFYLPADGSRLARLWLAWPRMPGPQDEALALAQAAAMFAAVAVIVPPDQEVEARRRLAGIAEVAPLAFTSPRVRDTGPTFLVDGKGGAAAVDWRFNGWGERRPDADDDRTFAHALLGAAEVRRFRAPLTLEPGAFTCDGHDTVLALAAAVFDPRRNPDLSRLQAFAILQQWLGVERVIWIEDAHPDDSLCADVRALAAFTAPGRIVVTKADADHPHAGRFAAVARDLARVRDAQGNTLDIAVLPAPPPGVAAPHAYTNFLAVNGCVLVPAYGVPADDMACGILAELFPNQEVRSFPAAALAAAGLSLTSLAVPHPARLLQRERATLLPRSARSQPVPDIDEMLHIYSDLSAKADIV